MITSAANAPWPFDTSVNSASAGLRAPSKVRMKIFTLDNRLILKRVGGLNDADRRTVARALKHLLGE